MVVRLRNNENVEEEIILGLLRYAYGIALRFIKTNPALKDDLISVALLALCTYTHKAKTTLEDNNLLPYLWVNIRYAILDFLSRKRFIYTPPREKIIPNPLEVDDFAGRSDDVDEMWEVLKKICVSNTETQILTLRVEGKKYKEICQILGISEGYISQILKKLYRRFKDEW